MTNLQQAGEKRGGDLSPATLKRLWLWTPIVAGGGVSLLLLLGLAAPLGVEIFRQLERLRELEQYRQEIEVLALQAAQIQKERIRAQRQKKQLIQLVTGKGDVATFLATLDLEAREAGVQLQLYEPVPETPPGAPGAPAARPGTPPAAPAAPATPPAPGQPPGAATPPPPPQDVMAQSGLVEKPIILTASGTYPKLLAFLRRMELLDVLVEQKDLLLTVSLRQPRRLNTSSQSELPPPVPVVEVKLTLTLWSKAPKEETHTAPPAAAPPGAPAAPAAPPAKPPG